MAGNLHYKLDKCEKCGKQKIVVDNRKVCIACEKKQIEGVV